MAADKQRGAQDSEHRREQTLERQSIHHFGERLKTAMNGLSNMELSRRSGLSETTIRKYLQGKIYPGLDSLALVADACGVSLAWLATGVGHQNKSSNSNQKVGESEPPRYGQTAGELEAILRRLSEQQKDALIDAIYRIGIEGLLRQLNTNTDGKRDDTAAE